MDQNEYDSNWYAGEADRRLDVGRAEHGEDEEKSQNHFGDKRREQVVPAGGMRAIAVSRKSGRRWIVPGVRAARDNQQNACGDNPTHDLCEDISGYIFRFKFPAEKKSYCDRRIDVAP